MKSKNKLIGILQFQIMDIDAVKCPQIKLTTQMMYNFYYIDTAWT